MTYLYLHQLFQGLVEGAFKRSHLVGTASGSDSSSHTILSGWLIFIAFFFRRLYVSLGMVRFTLLQKTSGWSHQISSSPTSLPRHGIDHDKGILGTWQPTSCGGLRNHYLLHPLEIGASLYFPLQRMKTGNPNRRHGICHRDGVKTFSTWRERTKGARFHRPTLSHSSEISASTSLPLPRAETSTTNRRHGLRQREYMTTFKTRRKRNKKASTQRLITAGSHTFECEIDPAIPAPHKRATC